MSFSTPDDMAHLEKAGISTQTTGWQMRFGANHYKYPDTVGNDTIADDVNFNSHEASEYAVKRASQISTMTSEPFMMYEFLKIDEAAQAVRAAHLKQMRGELTKNNLGQMFFKEKQTLDNMSASDIKSGSAAVAKAGGEVALDYIKELTTKASRKYVGSVSLYMPTDIQIADTMLYNEDTRQFAAGANELITGGTNAFNNAAVKASKQAITLGSAVLGRAAGSGIIGALAGYGLGDIVSDEMQRSTGQMLNPNEFISYQSTGLRNFTFNYVLLPDSESESNQITGLIKLFRKAAHATKNSQITITVPDQVIVSFHGARDMIQLPPCVIESVNVTYNPNVSSFFKQNNSPVEVGLSITLKELVPLYADDVEGGF
tara:strand:- start:2653 stop:3771 length:1119 start_codon:yes stop_codon:yes gene_type:complete